MKKPIQDRKPDTRLSAFDSYDDYLNYAQTLFELTTDEYRLLYHVLVKLENVGEDPLKAMHDCKYKMENHDCLAMLKFMMTIEAMDLGEIKMSA